MILYLCLSIKNVLIFVIIFIIIGFWIHIIFIYSAKSVIDSYLVTINYIYIVAYTYQRIRAISSYLVYGIHGYHNSFIVKYLYNYTIYSTA